MSIQLEKRAKSVGIILAKRGLTQIPPVRVGVAIDVSGSTQWMFKDGTIQETFDRLLAVALKFDDNGELDVWTFDTRVAQLETASADDEGKYVHKQIMENQSISKWGGTEYAPPLRSVLNFYFGTRAQASAVVKQAAGFLGGLFGKKAAPVVEAAPSASGALPAMLLFVTDGQSDHDDEQQTETIFREAAANPKMYFQLIGVGSAHFDFLERMANKFDNVGFVNLTSLSITDEQLYDQLITQEVVSWVKKAV